MPITSASRPVILRKMMRRLRLEKVTRANSCHPRSNSAANRRRPVVASEARSSRRSSSTLRLSSVRSSWLRLNAAARAKRCQRCVTRAADWRSAALASESGLSPPRLRPPRVESERRSKSERLCNHSRWTPRRRLVNAASSRACGSTPILLSFEVREKIPWTERDQPFKSSPSRRALSASDGLASPRSAATSVLKLSGVRLSTVGLSVTRPHRGPRRRRS